MKTFSYFSEGLEAKLEQCVATACERQESFTCPRHHFVSLRNFARHAIAASLHQDGFHTKSDLNLHVTQFAGGDAGSETKVGSMDYLEVEAVSQAAGIEWNRRRSTTEEGKAKIERTPRILD
jgi:hypothetical protein